MFVSIYQRSRNGVQLPLERPPIQSQGHRFVDVDINATILSKHYLCEIWTRRCKPLVGNNHTKNAEFCQVFFQQDLRKLREKAIYFSALTP